MKNLLLSVVAILITTLSFGQAGTITGPSAMCSTDMVTMTDTTVGGVWSISPSVVATISSSGVVVAVTAGVATVSYSLSGYVATHVITVNPMPTPISGPATDCAGSTATYTSSTGGGTWSVSSTAIASINPASGVLLGITPGIDLISYTIGGGCSSAFTVTINAASTPIYGVTSACVGSTASLADATPGGTWSSSNPIIASVDPVTGIVTANSPGTATISYTATSACGSGTATILFTVNPLPSVITGPSSVCVGGSGPISDSVAGGVWSSAVPSILSVSFLGSVTGVSPGTAVVTYTTPAGCFTTITITVSPGLPAIATSVAYGVCNGGIDTISAICTGATTFSWSPSSGLTCPTCAVTTSMTADTSTFTVIASDASGCTSVGTLTVDGNRIKGHIIYGSVTPSVTDTKVWLIQYNPTDSSLVAMDSLVTCLDGSAPYYQFNDKVSGNYLIKAKLLSSVAGTSDYIPTYCLSNPHWDTATTIVHGSGANTQDINMIYGTVPTGPGFIGGLIVAGAGKGTSGDVPAVDLLVYLEDGTGTVLTYTYTDASGNYSFSGLGYGDYVIYPTDYKYRTTPSPVLTLSSSASSVTAADFKKHTSFGTITPYIVTGVNQLNNASGISLSPNPASDVVLITWNHANPSSANILFTDMTGRVVYEQSAELTSGSGSLAVHPVLTEGQYFVRIAGNGINWTGRITIAK